MTLLQIQMMAFVTVILCIITASTACGQNGADQKSSASPAVDIENPSPLFPEQPDDGLLTLNAVIQMPDGSPAANAVMEHQEQWLPRRRSIVRADSAGRATVRDVFGNGALIHASSADGLFQATLRVDAQATRIEFAKPLVINLRPCVRHRVIVDFEGQPVPNAHVIAFGQLFKVRSKTGPDGIIDLKLPADAKLNSIDVWDPDRAVTGIGTSSQAIKSDPTRLSLRPPSPFLLRAINPDGKPAVGVELGLDFGLENGEAIHSGYFPGAHVRTNERGEANVTWAPEGNLRFVYPTIVGSNWALQEIDNNEISNRIVTITVRHQKAVQCRLRMPDGVSARGILIGADGFGPGSFMTKPSARARADGTFDLPAVSDFGFLIGTVDREWASEPWTGLIMARDDDEPAVIEIPVQPAIPITIRVTRGPDNKPETDAWIELEDQGRGIRWINSSGEKKTASGGLGSWLRTNSDGIAFCGAATGSVNLRLSAGAWTEEKNLKIKSAEPQEIRFHRP